MEGVGEKMKGLKRGIKRIAGLAEKEVQSLWREEREKKREKKKKIQEENLKRE